MKTAYELAMERLQKDAGVTKKLSKAQKTRIADIEKKYEAKRAEHRLTYDARIAAAATVDELNALRAESAEGLATLEVRRDKEKDEVWNEE